MKRGQITVFFSLILVLLLTLLGAVLESAMQQVSRSRIERSLVLGEYSFLSEYQKELWEQYDLFYLDTGYGTPAENQEVMKARLLEYISSNLTSETDGEAGVRFPLSIAVSNLEVNEISRMTDRGGIDFYEQAVASIQNVSGMDFAASWLKSEEWMKELTGWEEERAQAEVRERRNLEILRNRRLEEEKVDTPDPTEGVRQINEGLLALVIPETERLSSKYVTNQESPSRRKLLAGSGSEGRITKNAVNDQWFHSYLLEHYRNAMEVLMEKEEAGAWLAYEVEYILAGKDNDIENLKTVVNRLILLREGANYAYLLTDSGKQQEAYILAAVIAGLTFMPELLDTLQQVILLAWAYGESVVDVRNLLRGNKVELIKTSSSWNLPLSRLFLLRMHLKEYDDRTAENGMDYEGYLRLLLTASGRREKCMRSLDVIEGNLRRTTLGRTLYVDQCVDGFVMKADFWYSSFFYSMTGRKREHAFSAERKVGYVW